MPIGRERNRDQDQGLVRRILLALVLFGAVGLTVELALLEHTEPGWQWAPFGGLAAALVTGAALAARPGRGTVRAFQAAMASCVVLGLLGLWLHYLGNVEFEREMDEAARGLDLVWRALRGATPALAPGALAQLGLLGLTLTVRHPATRGGAADRTGSDRAAVE